MSANTFWTPDRVDRLLALRRAGQTFSQISAALGDGCSRSMVGAKLSRLGEARPPRRARVSREESESRASARRAAAPGIMQDRVSRFFAAAAAGAASVRLVDAHNHHCRWPFGEAENFRFCGAPADVAAGRPYCDRHDALAHGRTNADPARTVHADGLAGSAPRIAEAEE